MATIFGGRWLGVLTPLIHGPLVCPRPLYAYMALPSTPKCMHVLKPILKL